MDCRLQVFLSESAEFIATSSNADISETENVSPFFIAFVKSTLNLEYFEKKDQSQSLNINEIINCKTGSYLNVQKAIFHATPRQKTC